MARRSRYVAYVKAVRRAEKKESKDAKPKEHPLEYKEHKLLEGEISSAVNVKEGCRFRERCSRFKEGLCSERTPKLKKIGPDHYVACHYPLIG